MSRKEMYQLFGKKIGISSSDDEINGSLFDELSLYPQAQGDVSDLDIDIQKEFLFDGQSHNPSNHEESDYSVFIRSKQLNTCFEFDRSSLKGVRLQLNKAPNALRSWLQRFINIQYTNRQERIGQILHEEVLIPAVYFMEDRVLLHSSAIKKGDEVILIGGTGGVGKTSIELEMCLHEEGLFLADDISVLSADGFVYPNLNFPKIYGYNVQGNSELKTMLFQEAGIRNRIHWSVHIKRGPSFVRRRISPHKLYGKYASKGGQLTRYLILSRESREHISVEELDPDIAAQISVDILRTEYAHFHNHLYWHRLNSKVLNREALFSPEHIFNRWSNQLSNIFGDIKCELVKIPLGMEHHQFKKEMVALL